MPLNLRIALIPLYLMLLACVLAITVPPARAEVPITFPQAVQQSAMVIGRVPPGSKVEYAGRELRVTGYGTVVLGVPRDAQAEVTVKVTPPDAAPQEVAIRVEPRAWDVERISGVPPRTVSPPPEIAERIRREQAEVSASRGRDDPRTDFVEPFVWPVKGRISGRFGNMRVYNGTPGAPHSGMDIAAANGTPVVAPASGVVTFANPDLYLTGGTLLLDHGYGISSNFLHLSRIDVEIGQRVEQGEVIGAVGATGRATGPHLHWGMNWFDVRLDPLLVLERSADR